MKRTWIIRAGLVVGLLILILAVGIAGYLYTGYRSYQELMSNLELVKSQSATQDDVHLEEYDNLGGYLDETTHTFHGVWLGGKVWAWGREGPVKFTVGDGTVFHKLLLCGGGLRQNEYTSFRELVKNSGVGTQLMVEYRNQPSRPAVRIQVFSGGQIFGPFSYGLHVRCADSTIVEEQNNNN